MCMFICVCFTLNIWNRWQLALSTVLCSPGYYPWSTQHGYSKSQVRVCQEPEFWCAGSFQGCCCHTWLGPTAKSSQHGRRELCQAWVTGKHQCERRTQKVKSDMERLVCDLNQTCGTICYSRRGYVRDLASSMRGVKWRRCSLGRLDRIYRKKDRVWVKPEELNSGRQD